ncbi:DUF4142 domain-containing protein [Chitinophaga qingshengii]|uniref:DUF4142 domain-containing protein n=1 Tax=Chitinophaga qingshengii TaxID=1569794 RepID=A0ABR7TSJ8_9BACT|nr:DUF4142 domain-containing protein [Chitinophaga qingshengii]MBC9933443.1 DUF4142 domain-containing protein [Chitinophaga qingshengii]
MKKITFMAAALLGTWMLSSCGNNARHQETPVDSAKAANKTDKAVDPKSADFAVNAANGGMMEVALGKLAQEKAVDPRVKAFATMMVNDHTNANNALKVIAEKRNLTLPAELSAESKNFLDRLSKKNGKQFDKEYIREMVDDHDQDVKDFDNAANNLEDVILREWARKMLPTLMMHQDSARAIKDSQ